MIISFINNFIQSTSSGIGLFYLNKPVSLALNWLSKTSIILLVLLYSQNSFSFNDLNRINLIYKYDPDAEVQYHYKVAVANDIATIFLRLDFNTDKVPDPDLFNISYGLSKDYTGTDQLLSDTVGSNNLILAENNSRYYRFTVPVVKNETIVFLKVFNPNNNVEFIFDVPVDVPLQFKSSPLVLMESNRDIPIFSEYIGLHDSIRIVSVQEGVELGYFYYYSADFSPADPPMTIRQASVEKDLQVDSSATFRLGETIILHKKGLYFFQNDTTSAQGISIMVNDPYYPQFVRAENLVEPIIYISTSREMRKVRDNEDKKKAMDIYWLELTKSPERSKKIIRDYYKQIELANYLYTSYKEGWKTDKGMIMALYGKPDAVFTDGEIEEWIYERRGGTSRISFTFVKIKSVFSDNHYELVRNKGYEREWFRIVDQWRKGRQEI
ncbi:MAG: GWxTD domain-containing protein [Bacteroidota bacterium]|nr:GWxTD domain-containing protein [Bacteroidota bacterium]